MDEPKKRDFSFVFNKLSEKDAQMQQFEQLAKQCEEMDKKTEYLQELRRLASSDEESMQGAGYTST